jgi:hypothetical protein
VTSSTIAIFLFDMVSLPESVFQESRDDLRWLDAGTKPVAAHTLGLAKFSSAFDRAVSVAPRETNSR